MKAVVLLGGQGVDILSDDRPSAFAFQGQLLATHV